MNHSRQYTETEFLNNVRKNKMKTKNSLLKLENNRKIEDGIIKDVRNIFGLNKTNKEIDDDN